MKVLYICPFAHYSGHHPWAAITETKVLNQQHEVTLLTFCGVLSGVEPSVNHVKVMRNNRMFVWLRSKALLRWGLMVIETALTICKAISMRKNYDILHLRDGEPFLFIPFLLSIGHRNLKWFISATGSIVFVAKMQNINARLNPLKWMYVQALQVVNSRLWLPIYRLAMRFNSFVLVPQNERAGDAYRAYMRGIFDVQHVELVPMDIGQNTDKKLARKKLGIPENAFVVLSFGAPHAGKDIDCIFKAVATNNNVFLLSAGTHVYSLDDNPTALAEKYNLNGRCKVINKFIPPHCIERDDIYGACDAILMSYKKEFVSTSSMLHEAAGRRIPVICSDANLLGHEVRKYNMGMTFLTEDAEDLAENIDIFAILVDVESYKQGCDAFCREHSVEKWLDDINGVYRRLLKIEC